MVKQYMALKADLRHFIDDEGNVVALTEQAKPILKFLANIILAVSENIEQSPINVDLKCNSRASELSCEGDIDATCTEIDMIEWHCDTCEASGTIANWQGSMWDKQIRIIH